MPPPYKRRVFVAGMKKKGFGEGEFTKHGVLELKDERGAFTGIKVTVINPHAGFQGEVTWKIISQVSIELGVYDKQFVCDLVECPASHEDLLMRLRQSNRI